MKGAETLFQNRVSEFWGGRLILRAYTQAHTLLATWVELRSKATVLSVRCE